MRTREEYENLINCSPLFKVDKDRAPVLYKTERYRFLTLLTEYYQIYIFPYKKLEEYSLPLMESAADCVKHYSAEKGEFLHLFNYVFMRNLRISQGREKIDAVRQGIRIDKNTDELIRKIVRFVKNRGWELDDPAVIKKIAVATELKEETVVELLRINAAASVSSSIVQNEDGDEVDLFDLMDSSAPSAEGELIDKDNLSAFIDRIERAFRGVQERQKNILSMLLTVKIAETLESFQLLQKFLCGRTLFSEEIIQHYYESGELPTARQIAKMCGVSEQSLSRTFKNFKKKISEI